MTIHTDTHTTLPGSSKQNDDKAQKALPKLALDTDKYRAYLRDFDLTEEQQNEMLEVLWYMMSTLVDIGWNVDSIPMFLPDLFEKSGADSGKLVQQTHTPSLNTMAAKCAETKDHADDK